MNRIIKFRAKTLDGIWFYWSLLDDIDMGKLAIDVNTVCQSTNLFDKNGKEIFEGDIIETEGIEEGPFAVGYEEVNCRFAFTSLDGNWGSALKKGWTTHYEVIGNIYDNSELLNP